MKPVIIMEQGAREVEKTLQETVQCGKISIKDGYVVCPTCRRKTSQAVRPDTVATHLQLWCRHCKTVHIVDIACGQCSFSQCPT